jgi:hypothetical protein
MRDRMIVLTAASALVLATICFASPYATVTLNVAQTEVLAVDFFHLTENTQTASQQRLARH